MIDAEDVSNCSRIFTYKLRNKIISLDLENVSKVFQSTSGNVIICFINATAPLSINNYKEGQALYPVLMEQWEAYYEGQNK